MNQVTLFRDNETGLDFAAELGEVTPVSWQPTGMVYWQPYENLLPIAPLAEVAPELAKVKAA